ncbi:MAG: hypothetical protein ABFR50_09415 [Candidatus Fermentibacteria bacterium]
MYLIDYADRNVLFNKDFNSGRVYLSTGVYGNYVLASCLEMLTRINIESHSPEGIIYFQNDEAGTPVINSQSGEAYVPLCDDKIVTVDIDRWLITDTTLNAPWVGCGPTALFSSSLNSMLLSDGWKNIYRLSIPALACTGTLEFPEVPANMNLKENDGDIFISFPDQGLWKASGSTMSMTTELFGDETRAVEAVNGTDLLMIGAGSGIIVIDRNNGEQIDSLSCASPATILAVSDDGEYCAAVLDSDKTRILFFER